MPVTFYVDEHTPNGVIEQLRRREIAVVRFEDNYPKGADDALHLDFATENNYVVVTRDVDFFRLQQKRWQNEQEAAGVVYVQPDNWENIGLQVTRLSEINEQETAETMADRQVWI